MTTYRHTPEMGQISGFGGGYEVVCQNMLEAGVNWIVAHRGADIVVQTASGVFGVSDPVSDDAKALSEVVLAAVDHCTGGMHHAVMSRLTYIANNGWEKYCEVSIERTKNNN